MGKPVRRLSPAPPGGQVAYLRQLHTQTVTGCDEWASPLRITITPHPQPQSDHGKSAGQTQTFYQTFYKPLPLFPDTPKISQSEAEVPKGLNPRSQNRKGHTKKNVQSGESLEFKEW